MYKALKSFSGKISMAKGQVKDIKDKNIAQDLLNAGYIEEIKEEVKKVENVIKEEVEKVEEKVEEKIENIVKKKNNKKKSK